MSARAMVFQAINREPTARWSRLHALLPHAMTTVGLLAMLVDSSADIGSTLDAVLSGIVTTVWAWFVIVWLSRAWVAPEAAASGSAGTPQRLRVAYLTSADGVIDLVAALALPAGWISGIDPRDAQLLAVVWTLKYIRESTGLSLLLRVMRRSLSSLLSVVTVFFVVFLIAATLSHVFEREAQPRAFGSIPGAMWWAIVTLTTTGYGDVVPATPFGRLLAGWVMVGGTVIFALWAGILANAYAEELRRRDFLLTWDLVAKIPFFNTLGAAALADIVSLLQSQDAAAGHVIIREGSPGDSMYFIVDGEATVMMKPEPIRLGPGAFFGEMALLFGAPRSATVMVTKPSTFLVLDVANYRALAGRRPELLEMIEAEGQRRRNANLARRDDGATS